jgi:hypothetical protein
MHHPVFLVLHKVHFAIPIAHLEIGESKTSALRAFFYIPLFLLQIPVWLGQNKLQSLQDGIPGHLLDVLLCFRPNNNLCCSPLLTLRSSDCRSRPRVPRLQGL